MPDRTSSSEVSPQLLVIQGFVLLLEGILRAENQPKTWPRCAGASSACNPWPALHKVTGVNQKGSFQREEGYFEPARGVLGLCRG